MIYKILNEKETVMKTHNRSSLPANPLLANEKKVAIPSGNAMQSIANTNPEEIEIDKLKWIKNQHNIVELYQKFFFDTTTQVINKFNNDILVNKKYPTYTDKDGNLQLKNPEDAANINTIIQAISTDQGILMNAGCTDQQLSDILTNGYIPEALSEKECRAAIDLILQNSKLLVSILTLMIKMNYRSLNLSVQEASNILSALKNDSTTHLGMGAIKDIFSKPEILKKYRLGQYNYDFRPLGGACMFLSKTPNVQVSYQPAKKMNLIFRYDAVVMAHGNEYDKGNEKGWYCEPVSTLQHSNITDVVDLLYTLRKEGFKNVFIGCCNPSGIEVPDDLKNDKKFHYTIPKQITYLESNICEDEQEIISIYNELQTLCNDINIELLTEGRFTEFIKNSIKRVGTLVKKLWTKLIEFFNKTIRSISEKVGRLLHIPNSKTKFKEPIDVSFVNFSGKSAKVDKKKCYSADDIKRSVDEANRSINDAIKMHQQKVDQALRNAEQRLKQVGVKESGIFNNTIFI